MRLDSINEGDYDSPELIEYKIQRAKEKAPELNGWDVVVASREQNMFYDIGDDWTITARFLEEDEDKLRKWVAYADGDKATMNRFYDERLMMWVLMATITYNTGIV